jgi:hypothetical protein
MLEEELRATIAAEAQPAEQSASHQEHGDLPLLPIRVEAHDITFEGKVVRVQVESTHTEADGDSYTVRQRRFYRWTEGGWVGVPPSSDILGPLQSYETSYFTFSYFKIDAASVQEVAAEIDTIYAQLRRDYALLSATLSPDVGRTTIVLTIDPAEVEYRCYQPHHLCLPSPALAALPDGLLESDALRLWLLTPLVNRVYLDATEIKPFRYEWHDAAIVLPHLLIRQHSDLLSAWHTDLVRWLYRIPTRTPKPDAETLAQELAGLCARHQIEARRDFYKGATLLYLCTHSEMLNLWLLTNYESPEQVGYLRMPNPDLRMSDRSWGGDLAWREILEVEVLLDYTVATYGREALPALVEGFRSYSSWDTLVPAVLAISVKEFERGWHEYLHKLP